MMEQRGLEALTAVLQQPRLLQLGQDEHGGHQAYGCGLAMKVPKRAGSCARGDAP